MTTNPRDAMADAMQQAALADPDDLLSWRALADVALDALCPPGGRVVVDRTETKPCERCEGLGRWYIKNDWHWCSTCRGSGVVEATTIHGLEPFGYRCMWEGCDTYLCDGVHYEGSKRAPVVMEVESWALVALPEETPQ